MMRNKVRFSWANFVQTALVLVALFRCVETASAQTETTLGPLGRLVDFVAAAGKPTVLNAPQAEAFGLAKAEIPMRALAFKPPGDDHLHIILVGGAAGQVTVVLTHTTLDQVGPMWLTTPSGILLKTIYEDPKGIAVVKDRRFDADFEAQKTYLLSKVPSG